MKTAILALMSVIMAVLLLLASPPVAQAQAFDLTVMPAKVEITAQPGQNLSFTISLLNQSSNALQLQVYPMDYYVNPDNTFVFEEPGHYSYSCANWVQIRQADVSVPPNSQIDQRFDLNVPKEAEPGGHYAVIFFQDAAEPKPGQGVAPQSRVGSLVLLTVPGQITREVNITGFNLDSDYFSLWGKSGESDGGWPARTIRYHVEMENTGNVHATVYAQLHYWSRFGFGAGTVDLGSSTILPGTVRYFDGALPNPPGLGLYKAEVIISYGPDQVTLDTEKRLQTSFKVIPVLWIMAIILGLLLLWLMLRFFRRKFRVSIRLEGRDKAPAAAASAETPKRTGPRPASQKSRAFKSPPGKHERGKHERS
jgi:hypothetical protein